MEKHKLSKSTFLRGLKCPKALYLHIHHPKLRTPPDEAQLASFREGREVGQVARKVFPGGVDARRASPFNAQKSVVRTRELIEGGAKVLYEAAFQHAQVLAYVDILVKENDLWKAYEVKSSTSVKDVHIEDVSLQAHLIHNSDIRLDEFYLMHIDNSYVREGALDPNALFSITPLLEETRTLESVVPGLIEEFKEVLLLSEKPDIDIGPYCFEPYDCDFFSHCWKHVPKDSVFNLSGLTSKKKFDLYYRGLDRIEDVPIDYPLSDKARELLQSHREDHPIVNLKALQEFLEDLEYPLHFMDFETINPAIPLFDFSRPYQMIPYQYSLHLRHRRGETPEHKGFLGEPDTDPRREFVESLIQDTEQKGHILVYNLSFEAGRLQDLAGLFPEHRTAIEERLSRMVDLMVPFWNRDYYLPAMLGSYSIKNVLPALAPDLRYKDLVISDGVAAMEAFRKLGESKDTNEIEHTRSALWEYCKLDTYAMVRIYDELVELVGE
jgi:predicted RecB family nuclease